MLHRNQTIQLPDGRLLGYNQYGPPDGTPVFHFHGTPSSRIEWGMFGGKNLVEQLNVRLIAPDRPGMGISTFQAGRRISDWPRDVLALADALGLQQFAVLGYSGGGPYALACAAAFPERLTRIGVLSGSAPGDHRDLSKDGMPGKTARTDLAGHGVFTDSAHRRPRLARLVLHTMRRLVKLAPRRLAANAMLGMPEADRQVLARRNMMEGFLEMLAESLRQGSRGPQRDALLINSTWDFRPVDICSPVQLWHGQADRNVPPEMGKYVAAMLPGSHLTLYPNEGHISLFANHTAEFLSYLTQ